MRTWSFVFSLIALFVLAACQEPAPQVIQVGAPAAQTETQTQETPETPIQFTTLRTYQVSPERFDHAFRVLNHLYGKIVPGPEGTFVLVAPEKVHDGVIDFLKRLESLPAPKEAGPKRVRMTYWLVEATPRAGLEIGAGLNPIEATLKEVAATQGSTALGFSLLERFELLSNTQDGASARGRFARIEQRFMEAPEGVNLDLEIQLFRGRDLQTRLHLSPGETLVLGQVGAVEALDEEEGKAKRSRRQVTMVIEGEQSQDEQAETARRLIGGEQKLLFFVARATVEGQE